MGEGAEAAGQAFILVDGGSKSGLGEAFVGDPAVIRIDRRSTGFG